MKNTTDNKKNYPTKTSLILRIAASLYLLYLAWELKDAPSNYTGVESIVFIIAIIVFLLVAIIIGGLSIKAYAKGEYKDKEVNNGE